MASTNGHVLVLNLDYQPINICGTHRAVKLVFLGKAEILEDRGELLMSPGYAIPRPSVIKLSHLVRRPQPQLKLSRKAIFARDHYQCQYCGRTGLKMTIDHIVPRHLGGTFSWENLVCACHACNARKGDRTTQESGLKLLKQPEKPSFIPYISYTLYRQSVDEENWRKYLPRKMYG
jgi:5-methylcytosine-specific restriction endonuclease McrA